MHPHTLLPPEAGPGCHHKRVPILARAPKMKMLLSVSGLQAGGDVFRRADGQPLGPQKPSLL